MLGETIRVRGVPLSWKINKLESFLGVEGEKTTLERDLKGVSQTATITLREVPDTLRPASPQTCRKIPLGSSSGGTQRKSLTVDLDFDGMTPLYAPREKDHRIE